MQNTGVTCRGKVVHCDAFVLTLRCCSIGFRLVSTSQTSVYRFMYATVQKKHCYAMPTYAYECTGIGHEDAPFPSNNSTKSSCQSAA